MLSVKCDNCDHLVKVEDITKEYKLPLLFIFLGLAVLVYVRNLSDPGIVITILGGLCATSGLVWLVVTRLVVNRELMKVKKEGKGLQRSISS
jgi:hypothetical protein